MTNEQLVRALNTIGKACFIKYYKDFSDLNTSREELLELITINEGYDERATMARINAARRIFNLGFEIKALKKIISSIRLDANLIKIAKDLLIEENNK